VIPPDIAICDNCLKELRDEKDRRHDYFFITCTDCGPRYTIIDALPYDRPRTTLKCAPSVRVSTKTRAIDDSMHKRLHAPSAAPRRFFGTTDGESTQLTQYAKPEGCWNVVKSSQ
jgi:hydrogenase maturation protein HypF